ncbi:hypothetical protein B0H11DRAFT_655605 [Mycena galericulata]|nr:hypothetical protein B0H11DRAFT_655605 [Mycena galericulata]
MLVIRLAALMVGRTCYCSLQPHTGSYFGYRKIWAPGRRDPAHYRRSCVIFLHPCTSTHAFQLDRLPSLRPPCSMLAPSSVVSHTRGISVFRLVATRSCAMLQPPFITVNVAGKKNLSQQ